MRRTAERHRRVSELYLQAREMGPEARAELLEGACGEDDALRREVETLLAAEEEMPSEFLTLGPAAALSADDTVSHYRLVERLGEGGMGEVWLAHDETLDRRVALKFPAVDRLGDPSRRHRLRREARAAAQLGHSAVCRVFELGTVDGRDFIAMEYVEGETLAARLTRGPIPLPQALAWGAAIAGALEAAHAVGIVHRDLKPANVLVTPSGEIKVADFGLARLLLPPGEALERADTRTGGLTVEGSILGTPWYMAPEQVRGQPADEQADLWALGCLLYEMLAGERPFPGETATEVVAAVLEREPEWDRLPPETPFETRRLLLRCLRKERRRRLRHAGDARLVLEEAGEEEVPSPLVAPPEEGRLGGRRWPWLRASVLVAVIAVTLAVWGWLRPGSPPPVQPVRFSSALPPGVSVTRGPGIGSSSVALSPDGRTLVIAGTGTDGQRLYQQPVDRLGATPLAGTEGGSSPFFSPDGGWIGFFADGRLKRVAASGGAAVDIVAVPGFPAGASWGPDGRIVFAFGARSPLWVVDARGGDAEPLTELDAEAGEVSHRHPEILPDGGALLFDAAGWVHALDLGSGRRTALAQGAAPRYAASGHVVLSRETALLVAPFDPARLELTGPVVPAVEGAADRHGWWMRHYTISRTGTLAYVPAAAAHALVLLGPDGTERLVTDERLSFENPQLSPDGRRLAVATTHRTGEATEIWVHELDAGTSWRLTHDGGRAPVWTPDGTAVTFSHLGGRQGIYVKATDGRGEAEQLLALDEFHWLIGWTPDGRTLAFGVLEGVMADGTSPSSIMAFTDGETSRVVGPESVWGGRLSPDGRWLAYYSQESGHFEVYVTPFPEGGTRWLISEDGGRDPTWGPDGTEVYYRSGDRLMAARIDTAAGVRVLSRRLVIEPFSLPLYDDYDIHPDGRTVVMVRPVGNAQGREVVMVLNWFSELTRLNPAR